MVCLSPARGTLACGLQGALPEKAVQIDSVTLPKFDKVDLYALLNQLLTQLILKAGLNGKALVSATAEVFSGIGTNLGNRMAYMGKLLPGASPSPNLARSRSAAF